MAQNMERYYGFRVILTDVLSPEKLQDLALRVSKIGGFNLDEYLLYCHQMQLVLDKKHWSNKIPLYRKVDSLTLTFTVNKKQQPKISNLKEGRIRFYNWYEDRPIEEILGIPFSKNIEYVGSQYEIDYVLENEYLRDNDMQSYLTFKNVILTFVDRELSPKHRKIKAHVKAQPTNDYLAKLRKKFDANRETQIDCYFTKPLELLPLMDKNMKSRAEVQRVFVFTDLVNSTGVKSQMPGQDQTERDRAYRNSILLPHRKRVEQDLSSYGGQVVDTMGDGYFLVFESVAKAVQWAVQLQRDHQQNPIQTPRERQKVKIGLHFGSALAEGPQFIGQAVDYAARVVSLGVGDQIILSEAAKALLDNAQVVGLRCRALGERFLKGIGRVPVFEVLYEGYPNTSSTAAQLEKVSLERELEHLTQQYEAVDGQYHFETNPATKINFKAQREYLLEQIESVEGKLNFL